MYAFKFIHNLETDTNGFCTHNDQICIVCFRGTETARNWLTNLNFPLIETGQFPQRYLKSGVRIHQGFNDALQSVWDQVESFVQRARSSFPNIKVYVCGHSLGGALATLCFGYMVLSDYPIPVTAVYTIGQPRAGNKKFIEALEFASPNTKFIRITNNQDCVPSLASGQHCGLHVHIDAAGRLTFVWFLLLFSLPPYLLPHSLLPSISFPFLSYFPHSLNLLFPFPSFDFPHSIYLLFPLSLFLPFLYPLLSLLYLPCSAFHFVSFVPLLSSSSLPPYLPFGFTISHWLPFIYFPFILLHSSLLQIFTQRDSHIYHDK